MLSYTWAAGTACSPREINQLKPAALLGTERSMKEGSNTSLFSIWRRSRQWSSPWQWVSFIGPLFALCGLLYDTHCQEEEVEGETECVWARGRARERGAHEVLMRTRW